MRRSIALLAATAVVGFAALIGAAPAQAAQFVPISGSGSTWSSNAVQQWAANVRQFGMTVNFQANGSSQGRKDFYNQTVDFAISEIPYGLTDNGSVDTPPNRGYAYMPIVAGGTSFMYNLKIGNNRVTNLRLSGGTLAKIFTGLITRWNDPAIAADNPQLTLPARKIIPVVRSDGSGTTAQFTLYMSKRFPQYWNPYCVRAGRSSPCGFTSYYPVVPGSGFTAQSLSTGVSGYVAQDGNEGSITYVEYSYAQQLGFPVVKLLNQAGYYVLPTAQSVAVALLQARIQDTNPAASDYLTQILDGVYAATDPRAYPLSSYSYMIVPTQAVGSFDSAKGYTLASFANYFLCDGQQQAPELGYSPLPRNLVEKAFDQVQRIPGAPGRPDITKCNNPTFSPTHVNLLADTAPYPAACDKQGSTQCTTSGVPSSTGAGSGSTTAGGTGGAAAGGTAGGAGASTTAASGGGHAGTGAATGARSGTAAGSASAPSAAAAVVDPVTGQTIAAAGTTGGGAASNDQSGTQGSVSAVPVSLSSDYTSSDSRNALMALAALLLLGVVVGPPLIARRLDRAGRG